MNEYQKFSDRFTQNQFEPYIKSSEIDSLTDSLAHTISEKYKGKELIVLGILKGSIVFLSDLIRKIEGVELYVDFLKLSALGRTESCDGTIVIDFDITLNVKDKAVLIVEEIIDTGRAVRFLMVRLAINQPLSMEVVTLFDKPYKRVINLVPDLIGKKVEDEFLVGHGLDLNEYGRNLKEVYFLKYPN